MLQVGIILSIVAGTFFALEWANKRFSRRGYVGFLWLAFGVYALGNLYFTLLSRVPGSGTELVLQPFQAYTRLDQGGQAEAEEAVGFAAAFLKGTTPLDGIILNVLLYVPLGYLLSRLFPRLKVWQVILIGLLCSLATEATQYLFKLGWCETDDVIHNTLGTAIGVWMRWLQLKRRA